MAVSEDPKHEGVDFSAPRTLGQRALKQFCRYPVELFFRVFIRLEPVHAERVPADGPVVIAPSHRSNIDTPIIGAALPRDSRFMAKETIFKNRFWTKFLVGLGGFPVKRGTFDRRSLGYATEILGRGEMLVVYPEGARQQGPRIKPVFEGALWLAARTNATVIPVGIGGSDKVMGIGKKMISPHKVVVVFGEPINVINPDEPGKRLKRSHLDAYAAELREAVQVVYDDAQIRAGSPNRKWSEDEPGINDRLEPWMD